MIKTFRCALLFLCIGATATPVPIRAPDILENAKMNFLVGNWNCTEMVRGRARPSRETYRWTPDGHWLIMDEIAAPFDRYRNTTYLMEVRYTYDAGPRKWIELTSDNTGYYGYSYAAPWSNDRLVTRDALNKDRQLTQDVFVRLSDTKITDTFTGINFKMKPDTVTCVKM